MTDFRQCGARLGSPQLQIDYAVAMATGRVEVVDNYN